MGVGGQHHASAALRPGKTRYPSYRRLGGPQGRSGRVRKISPPPGFDPRTVQPVASRYADWAIPATRGSFWHCNKEYVSYYFLWKCLTNLNKTGNVRLNETSGRLRENVVVAEKQKILRILFMCLSPIYSSTQSACAVLYRHLWPRLLYHNFTRYLKNCTNFG